MSDSATLTGLIFLGRTLQFGSGMLLVNVAVFRWLVLPSASPEAGGGAGPELPRFLHRLDTLFVASALLLVLSGGLLFLGAAAGMSGTPLSGVFDPALLSTVLRQTEFGRVCQVRAALALVLAIVIWNRPRLRTRHPPAARAREILAAVLAAALFLSVAWTGHAAATERPGLPWPLLSDTAHLAFASIWPAGLLPFALFLGAMKNADRAHLDFVLHSVRRFSNLSLGAVSALALTGIANGFFLVGTFENLIGTDYGRILDLKLFLFLLMLAIAGWNRQVLLPRLFTGGKEAEAPRRAVRLLRTFVVLETCLAAAVILVVAVLGVTPPPALPS